MSLAEQGDVPVFPPLLSGQAVLGEPPFATACAAARAGTEGGLILYDPLSPDLHAAAVFAPEVPRREAAVMLPLAGVAPRRTVAAGAEAHDRLGRPGARQWRCGGTAAHGGGAVGRRRGAGLAGDRS